jgi:hypothetical protein
MVTIPLPPFMIPGKLPHIDWSVVQGLWLGAFLSTGKSRKVVSDDLLLVGRMTDAGLVVPHLSIPPSWYDILTTLFGSSTARFSNFIRGPNTVRAYLRDAASWKRAGHNPLGALSVVALLGLVAAQVGLGLIATDEDGFYEGPLAHFVSIYVSDAARELHEQLFNVLLAFIALHVAAIIYYRFKGKHLFTPMITGKGELDPGVEPMRRGKWWVALLCVAAAIAITRLMLGLAPAVDPYV